MICHIDGSKGIPRVSSVFLTDQLINLTQTFIPWWLSHPSEKYEFVSWDDYSQYGYESKLCMERSAVFRTYGTKGLRNCSCSGPLECDEIKAIHTYVCIYIYTYCKYVCNIHLRGMFVKATHAGCRSFSLLICTYLHDILAVHLFNAGLPCMASSRALARTQPVASVIHRLPCEAVHTASDLYVRTCHLFTREWVRGGTGLVRVWNGMERGLERNGPLQHSCHHAAHIYQPRSASLSKLADWSESRLPAGWQLASASLPSNITAVPQQATTVSGAGGNLPQVEREGYKAIHS